MEKCVYIEVLSKVCHGCQIIERETDLEKKIFKEIQLKLGEYFVERMYQIDKGLVTKADVEAKDGN